MLKMLQGSTCKQLRQVCVLEASMPGLELRQRHGAATVTAAPALLAQIASCKRSVSCQWGPQRHQMPTKRCVSWKHADVNVHERRGGAVGNPTDHCRQRWALQAN